jgi:hypothetical protein
MRLAEAGLAVRDIDLGGFDAESDHKLAEDFVRTPLVDEALTGRGHLFLGRKGSGKSALFRQLPALSKVAQGPSMLAVTPDDYAWSALKAYREQGLAPEQAHTNAWKFTLAVELASYLIALELSWSEKAFGQAAALKTFIERNFGKQRTRGLLPATSLLKGIESFDLSAFGFGVGLTRKDVQEQALTPALIEVLLSHLEAPLQEYPLLLELDRLDDAWDGTSESQSLLVGLLKASKDINDRFHNVGNKNSTRVLVFLRTDIYDSLRFDDKDKHRPFEQRISWSGEQLTDLVARRLPKNVTFDGIFESGKLRGSTLPVDYLLRRTFLRPREVLQYVDLCLKLAGTSAVEVTKRQLREAEVTFSSWKVDDLKQEYSKALPDFEPLLEALRQQVHRYDTFYQLAELLQKKQPDIVGRLGLRKSLELLFETSVIGIRLRGAGQTRYKSSDPSLALPTAGTVYIHQGLVKGLNVREARAPAGGGFIPSDEDADITSA